MTKDEVLAWLRRKGTKKTVTDMTRYGIPNERAFGVPMGEMKRFAKAIGRDHRLAQALWKTGWYEARTVAVFVDDPEAVTRSQMNAWARDFDSWAICDTACFHLFDRTPFAWDKVEEWTRSRKEFVRRAGFALIWALSVHDKTATDTTFKAALKLIGSAEPDGRPLVDKAVDMALRATGKRNAALNGAAIRTAKRLAKSADRSHAWIGRHALRELESRAVQARLRS